MKTVRPPKKGTTRGDVGLAIERAIMRAADGDRAEDVATLVGALLDFRGEARQTDDVASQVGASAVGFVFDAPAEEPWEQDRD